MHFNMTFGEIESCLELHMEPQLQAQPKIKHNLKSVTITKTSLLHELVVKEQGFGGAAYDA